MSTGAMLKSGLTIAVGMGLLSASQAQAAHGERLRYSRAEAEIESLDANMFRTHDGWELRLRYRVEIEDTYPGERFDLILDVTQHGEPLRDIHGQPRRFVVPLDRPYEVDDDELEFRDVVALRLSDVRILHPRHLRLHAVLVPRGSNRALDHQHERIRARYPVYRYGRGHAYPSDRYPYYRDRGFNFRLHWD